MWGYAGQSFVAKKLYPWATNTEWSSWPDLANALEEKYLTAVKRTRANLVNAGMSNVDHHPFLKFGVIFGGFIRGKPGYVVAYPPTGNVATFEIEDSSLNQPFAFGGGAPIAVAAWEVLKRFKGDCEITTPEQLGEFMDAVCLSSQGYAHPVNLWRVDADGSHPVVRQ